MKYISKFSWIVTAFIFVYCHGYGQNLINLSGTWRFRLDAQDEGIKQQWYNQKLQDTIHLPGSLQDEGYGNEVTAETVWYSGKLAGIWRTSPLYAKYRQPGNVKIFEWLQPLKHYIGAAWYQRKVRIPAGWGGRRIKLFLERVHWSSTVWVDGREVGTQRSLAAGHEYDVTDFLSPGFHWITIRVDNSQIVDIGKIPHSVSDETQTAWNGIIGKIRLSASPMISIEDVQIYPDIASRTAKVRLTIDNSRRLQGTVNLTLRARSFNCAHPQVLKAVSDKISISDEKTVLNIVYPIGDKMQLWSPFHPSLYRMSVDFLGEFGHSVVADTAVARFGMREFTAKGTQFELNGQITSLRGDVNCAVFPLTGYPEMGLAWWHRLFKIYQAWGLNAVRFHSWCPPEAAFEAADEVGFLLEPEVDEWSHYTSARQDSFFREESALMLKRYGNHPSFAMMALGNELNADSSLLYKLVDFWEKTDNRHLYTGKIAGNPVLNNFQFYNTGRYEGKALRYHSGPAGGWPPPPRSSLFNVLPPETTLDYHEAVGAYPKPLITHELGQRCAYPDVLRELPKYKGFLKATYLEIARDQLQEHGLLSEVGDFVRASGKWQIQLYKEEIEANMRTAGIGGFNLLSLEDFPGQSSAPVGFLNAFYENKGYITPAEFRRFCSPRVILAKIPKRILEGTETFQADLLMYNFAEETLKAPYFNCEIKDEHGNVVWTKRFPGTRVPIGNDFHIGSVLLGLSSFKAPAKYNFAVSIPGTGIENAWDFWVFPASVPHVDIDSVMIAHVFDAEVVRKLRAGATVLLLPDSSQIKGRLPICFTDFYWTAFGLEGGISSADGLFCNPRHPVFKYFPTSYYTDWQWWDLLTHARPMIFDSFEDPSPWPKAYRPLVQMIDSWKVNRKLGVLVEAKLGKGRLMICSIDIEHDLNARPATRQFRYSLFKYITSKDFHPHTQVTPAMVSGLFTDNAAR